MTTPLLRERPIIRTDSQMRTMFGFGWVGLGKPGVPISSEEKICTPRNTVLFMISLNPFLFFKAKDMIPVEPSMYCSEIKSHSEDPAMGWGSILN